MTISTVTSTNANTVAPFVSLGRQAVGQESTDLKNSTFKPLEQPSSSARSENGRAGVATPETPLAEQPTSPRKVEERQGQADQNSARRERVVKEQEIKDQKQIAELSAIDSEVRAHEMAHAAAGGRYAGSPTYSFVKGPNGVNYAVGGEVPIDTAPIPNDPEATLRKAQQVQQAANAPADPSPQDRRVAAEAASLQALALAQIQERSAQARVTQSQESNQKYQVENPQPPKDKSSATQVSIDEKVINTNDDKKTDKDKIEKEFQDWERRRQEGLDILIGVSKKAINLNRHLVEIGAVKGLPASGNLLNAKA